MRASILVAAAAAAFAFGSVAQAQAVGSWVLSQTGNGGNYFPGVVTARAGNTVTVRFDDGTSEVRPANLLRAFNWRAGSRVVCRFTDGSWYDATITSMGSDGLTMNVRYDDGDTQRTQTGRCRVG